VLELLDFFAAEVEVDELVSGVVPAVTTTVWPPTVTTDAGEELVAVVVPEPEPEPEPEDEDEDEDDLSALLSAALLAAVVKPVR
jgi:hypothetical protein